MFTQGVVQVMSRINWFLPQNDLFCVRAKMMTKYNPSFHQYINVIALTCIAIFHVGLSADGGRLLFALF